MRSAFRTLETSTTEIVFRRCEACGQINIVKDEYVCAVCDERLPKEWNFDGQAME